MAVQHWMTFGTFAEQRFFIYPRPDTYDGIILNGNMVAHAPDGLASFLLEKTKPQMPYIIDPLTHAFQHDPVHIISKKPDGTEEVKSSILKLANRYGATIRNIVGKKPLLPNDFGDVESDNFIEFVTSVLQFQKDQLSTLMVNSDINVKYLEHNVKDLHPYALVAPYFYITESSINRWLPLAKSAAEKSVQYGRENSLKVFGAIVVDQGIILNEDLVDLLISTFRDISLDGFLLWVDNLDEHDSGSRELDGLIKLCIGLRNTNKELINIHGGYFSLLAASESIGKKAFTGVSHGPEFGESRAVVPVGGGIPMAKYYLPILHNRVKYRDTLRFLNAKDWLLDIDTFHSNVCDCSECKVTLNGNINNFIGFGESTPRQVKRKYGSVTIEVPTREAKEHCLRHYLNIKAKEFTNINTKSKDDLLAELTNAIAEFESMAGIDFTSYLEVWRNVLA